MAAVYDNWERLVQATLLREELRITALRTPSDLSLASSSFNFSSSSRTLVSSFNFSGLLVGDSFSYHQILQATDYLSSSSLIKHGRSGDIFSGVLEDGLRVVVKKVDLSSAEKESYLRSELEFFGKLSHSRFVPFLGHCLENWNDKFLVYKYMPNKDLSSSLCGEMVSSGDVKCKSSWLDWRTRLKIATGVAQCLCYLHHECVPPLVHRNVEGSSILIDENFEAWLGSFTEVCTEKKDGNLSRLYKFLRFPMGYEQGTTGASNATCAYDVYCFGKILLELVTGKLGFSADTHPRSGDWMENALPYINTYDKELFMNIVNPSLLLDDHLVIEVWAVAIVAKACLSPKPSKRPQMTYILESLQDPKSVRLSTHENPQSGAVSPAPAKTRKAEHNEQGTSQAMDSTTVPGGCTASQYSQYSELLLYHIANGDLSHLRVFSLSELKAATENFRGDRLLGEGGFGKVYKGWLHEKSIPKSNSGLPIAIKRLNPESMLGFAEWQTEIYMLGRLSHRNLIRLLGYCWEDKQLILVHEFMPKGSLDNHLFRRGHAVQPLPWDIRLKILIGAARGLAYLHALKGQVVFRNLKTSSILLDGSYNAKLSNFCLAKIGPPDGESHVSTRVMGTYGYAAPEYIATGHLYVKSDVYGFGVVLAEMLTGLRVVDVNRPSGQHNLIDWIKPFLFGRRRIKSIMDSRLEGRYPAKAAVNVAHLALNCLVPEPRARPSMKEVVDALEQIESASEKAQRNRTNLVQQTAHGNDQQHLHHRSSTSAKE